MAEKGIEKQSFALPVGAVSIAIIVAFLLAPPRSPLEKANLIGYAICHQLASRSYHPGGRQLPMCARCTGTHLGTLLGFISLWAMGRRRASNLPPGKALAVLVSFIALTAIDGLNSYLSSFPSFPHLYEPRNIFRLTTGTLNVLALSIIVNPLFNLTLWKEANPKRAIRNLHELSCLTIPAIPLIWAVHSQMAFLFYPLVILSILGVLVMLTVLNTMILLILTHRENAAMTWGDAFWPLTIGLAAAIMEIGAMVLVRATLPWLQILQKG